MVRPDWGFKVNDVAGDGAVEGGVRRRQRNRHDTALRVVQLLRALASSDQSVGVRELSRELGFDRSTVSRLFEQLRDLGYAKQDSTSGRYEVGPAFFALAAMVHSRDGLWQAAEPIVRQLANRFNETCYLAVREDSEIVFRDRVDTTHTLRYVISAGERAPLHAGAGGRAVLMALTSEGVRSTLRSTRIGALTSHTIVDIDQLVDQAKQDAGRGYAVSHGERLRGGSAIAAPFFDAGGNCGGSLVFTCPEQRFDPAREPEISAAVIAAAYELSERLGAFPATGRLPLLLQDDEDEAAVSSAEGVRRS